MTKHHRVAVVFDEHSSVLLPPLASRCHVWLADSDENQAAAKEYWGRAEPVDDELASGVTTFTREERLPEDALDVALELIEDHHGEFAHDPAVDEVLVIGLKPTEAVISVLRDWGYTTIDLGVDGILARRA